MGAGTGPGTDSTYNVCGIANGHAPAEETNIWTFESSINGLYLLDYILHSLEFR